MKEKQKDYFYLQKRIFPLYFKTRVLSIRTIICILLSLIPLFNTSKTIHRYLKPSIKKVHNGKFKEADQTGHTLVKK